MVEVRDFLYPYYSPEIEEELRDNGIHFLISAGKVKVNNVLALGKGKTGVVALTKEGMAVKIRRSDSPKDSLDMECSFQRSAYPVSPKVYSCGKNFILMEFIDGKEFPHSPSAKEMSLALISARQLDELNIQHKELVRPWRNILLTHGKAYILDYDSATFKPRPSNVTKILSSHPKTRELGIKYSKGEIDFYKLIDLIYLYL